MASSLPREMSMIDFERYQGFFPAVEQHNSNNFFRPWTEAVSDEFSGDSRSTDARALEAEDRNVAPSSVHSSQTDSCHPENGGSKENLQEGTALVTAQGRRKRRKSFRPHRSAPSNDPTFRGVTVSVQTHLSRQKRSKRWQSQLLIKSYFSVKGRRFPRSLRSHNPSYGDSFGDSSSESDEARSWTPENLPECTAQGSRMYLRYGKPIRMIRFGGKQCASCCARRTPLWRDAEDGTPLCNACGIRYKKYRVRCGGCWLIPRKDGKSFTNCNRCGQEFRVAVFRRSSKQ